jgi:hypothetical protein
MFGTELFNAGGLVSTVDSSQRRPVVVAALVALARCF